MKKTGTIIALTLLVLAYAWAPAAQSAGARALPLTLQLRFDEARPLNRDCFGANVALLHGSIWFDDPAFRQLYQNAGKPFFRFPGGTYANYYDPESGLMSETAPSHHDWKGLNRRIRQERDDGGKKPGPFFDFAEEAGARYSVVLNISTRTLEQNRAWLCGHQHQASLWARVPQPSTADRAGQQL